MLCRIKNVKNAINTNTTLHKTIFEYLANQKVVTPSPELNAIPLDTSTNLLLQVSGVDYEFR